MLVAALFVSRCYETALLYKWASPCFECDGAQREMSRSGQHKHATDISRCRAVHVAGLSRDLDARLKFPLFSGTRGRGQVGVSPTSPQLLLGRLPHVTDESAPTPDSDSDHTAEFADINEGLAGFGAEPELDQESIDAMQEAQRAMEDARSRLADVPAEVVVTNHVMGLYELAAIHLSATPPDLEQSVLAIDAVACLVDGLGDRLGEEAPTMRDALNNIRLAFVQIKGAQQPSNS